MADIRIKAGAALSLQFAFVEANGSATDLTDADLTAHVRDVADVLWASLQFVPDGGTGRVRAVVADTSDWPAGLLRCDLRLLRSGLTVISQTFGIYVDRAVTRP